MKPRKKRNTKREEKKPSMKREKTREKQARQLQKSMIFLRNKVDF
jgi:hypothetical protein